MGAVLVTAAMAEDESKTTQQVGQEGRSGEFFVLFFFLRISGEFCCC